MTRLRAVLRRLCAALGAGLDALARGILCEGIFAQRNGKGGKEQ